MTTAQQKDPTTSTDDLPPLKSALTGEVDLAVFLQEVDLESDNDEAFESEEAMARILEQDVTQV